MSVRENGEPCSCLALIESRKTRYAPPATNAGVPALGKGNRNGFAGEAFYCTEILLTTRWVHE